MTRIRYDVQTLEDTVDAWAEAQPDGGSFSSSSYVAWYQRRPNPKPASITTICKHLESTTHWMPVVHRRRERLGRGPGSDRVIEVPLICRGRGGGVWAPRRLSDWAVDNICGCALCREASIGETHPELVGRLVDPRDAHLAVSLWVPWACPVRDPDHHPIKATAASMAAGQVYCGGCRSKDEFYAKHNPGEVLEVTRSKPSTPLEERLRDALNEIAPGLRARTRRQIVIAKEARYHRKYTIAPDLVLVDRVAVEVDGGNGSGYSRHDRPEGVVDDARRDRLLQDVGWSVIRVRHPDGNGLRSSPATFVRTSSRSAAKIAPMVLEAFTQLRPEHPVSVTGAVAAQPDL